MAGDDTTRHVVGECDVPLWAQLAVIAGVILTLLAALAVCSAGMFLTTV